VGPVPGPVLVGPTVPAGARLCQTVIVPEGQGQGAKAKPSSRLQDGPVATCFGPALMKVAIFEKLLKIIEAEYEAGRDLIGSLAVSTRWLPYFKSVYMFRT
jgi:hypothetical protein